MRAGRLHAPTIEAIVHGHELRAPGPGLFVPALGDGDVVAAGGVIGELIVLGRASAVIVPRGAPTGVAQHVVAAAHAVGYGSALLAIDPSMQRGAAAVAVAASARSAVEGLVFSAPTSGRFYGRSAPDKPAFVEAGGELAQGATICLLEVMKTFHRVTYGGPGLPDTARVRAVLVKDGEDVNAGDPLLALE